MMTYPTTSATATGAATNGSSTMASRLLDIFENKQAGGNSAAVGGTGTTANNYSERVRPLASTQQQLQQFPNAVELNQLWLQALSSSNQQDQNPQQGMMTSNNMTAQRLSVLKQGGGDFMAKQEIPTTADIPISKVNSQQQHQKLSLLSSIVKPVDRDTTTTPQMMMMQKPNNTTTAGLPTVKEMAMVQQQQQQQGLVSLASGVSVIHQHHPNKELRKKHLNRVYAKHSREKKKNAHQKLHEDLILLQMENHKLREIVRTNIPDEETAQSIIKECCPNHPLDQISKLTGGEAATSVSGKGSRNNDLLLHGSDFALIENLIKSKQSFVITDPKQADNPIVYASESFYKLTLYTKEQTLGRNCRFLQGVGTNQRALDNIRKTIEGKGRGGGSSNDASTNLLNYKADGTPFWNQLFIAPLRDKDKNIVNYVGVQSEIEDPNKADSSESSSKDEIKSSNLIGQPEATASNVLVNRKTNSSSILAGTLDDQTLMGSSNQLQPISGGPLAPHKTIKEAQQQHQQEQFLSNGSSSNVMCTTSLPNQSSFPGTTLSSIPEEEGLLDWSLLAGALEDDFNDGLDAEWDDTSGSLSASITRSDLGWDVEDDVNDGNYRDHINEAMIASFVSTPRNFVAKTCRSELVDALLSTQGDVTDKRFLQAMDVLSRMYSSAHNSSKELADKAVHNYLNGTWVSLSKPSYTGCLGKNDYNEYIYTLGKMSFNMFKPGNLKCSVQHTLNNVKFVCSMEEAPVAIPWSLRRELAMFDAENEDNETLENRHEMIQRSTLRSYDIEIALTIEPVDPVSSEEENNMAPSKRLKAFQIVNGYMIPDPEVPSRLSVWFTGGKLSPASKAISSDSTIDSDDFEEWTKIFGNSSSTWTESITNMSAKLLFGAELPSGMNEADGSMSYKMNRPYGGHGKAYVDILYLDDDLYVTRGNSGTIHVAVRSSLLSPPPMPQALEAAATTVAEPAPTDTNGDFRTTESLPPRIAQQQSHIGEKRKFSNEEEEEASNAPASAETVPSSADDINVTTASWKSHLQQDLTMRGQEKVAEDLTEVLAAYGLAVIPTTKRTKYS